MNKPINIELIENYIKLNKLSKYQFCKNCKISISVLNKILNNQINIRIKALFKIAETLNINVADLVN